MWLLLTAALSRWVPTGSQRCAGDLTVGRRGHFGGQTLLSDDGRVPGDGANGHTTDQFALPLPPECLARLRFKTAEDMVETRQTLSDTTNASVNLIV